MRRSLILYLTLSGCVFSAMADDTHRINQEGRILGALPLVTNDILFDTSNADAVVSAMQIFPISNAWNEDISLRPVLSNSAAMIAQIMSDLESSRRTLITFQEMNYVLVPDSQPLVPVNFFDYPDQSDLNGGTSPNGLYPIPTNQPIESWPTQTGTQTLGQWQTNANGSDRHSITVEPGSGLDFETWMMQLSGTNWLAANGAEFNLNTNGLRPAGWTSGDAAGFPMFSAIVRYDEAERGMVEHACRLVVKRSLYGSYIYPATHFAAPSTNTSVNLPAMGQRLRLKSGFVIPASWTKEEKALLLGLKKYGAMVADNGNFFSISVTPDDRWPANCFGDLTSLSITNFEVIQTTGPNGGPRSPGAPVANAGPDQSILLGTPAQLQGVVSYSGAQPAIEWQLYSGPGTVTFGDATQSNTTATFSAPGVYTLMLSANDNIHTVAYNAVVITVVEGIALSISGGGSNVGLSWIGGSPPYVLQQAPALPAPAWSGVVTTSTQNAILPISSNSAYFRVTGQP
jgi:PKD domain